MTKNRFHHSDPWIFLSLNSGNDGTSLEALIAKADAINHAIPTEFEIEGAINRFTKAGLVNFSNSKFFLTYSGKEVYEYIYRQKGSMLTLWEELEKFLNEFDFPILTNEAYKLKPKELYKAYENYHRQTRKIFNEIKVNENKRKRL